MFLDDKIYKEIMEYSIIPAVDVLFISDKHKILLWLRDNKPLKWIYYFPWGRIEKGETIKQAAVRKMAEELWYKIDINRLEFLNVYDDIFNESIYSWTTLQNVTITYVYLLHSNEIISSKPHDSQHNKIKFFDVHDDTLDDRVKIRIKDLLNSNILNNDD